MMNIIVRHEKNPILSAKNLPYPSTLTYNAGVIKYNGKYIMVFRNECGNERDCIITSCNLGLAYSDDGIVWKVEPQPLTVDVEGALKVYDPRLTIIDDVCYMCFAVDTPHGIRGGIATTTDFRSFEIQSLSAPDNRNMVLFPEKIDGKYVRLERPFSIYGKGGGNKFDIWMSYSYDLQYWGNTKLVLSVEDVPFANDKIGPAAPPIKTQQGWLTLFHAVDIDINRGKNGWEKNWNKRYTVGAMLLDLKDPGKILAISEKPIMFPEETYETSGGFRNNVIFPGGLIEEPDGTVKIYYGSSDAFECLATAQLDKLLEAIIQQEGI